MRTTPTIALVLALLGVSVHAGAQAYDPDWKRGRIYYRMVCTACHVEKAGGAIPPTSRTMAEWKSYLQADRHAKGAERVSEYLSQSYRASVRATNKAAEKYVDVPDAELLADVQAFLVKSAKDGDSPAGCN